MADESSGLAEGNVEPLKATDGDGSSSGHPIAAVIAQKLRDCGIGCEIVHPVPTDAAVLHRDRAVIVLAVALLTALAWSYLLWLSADMHMGGMNMTGLRMIPSGMGLMMPADMPWRAMEFAFVFAMWTVMMVGMMTPSAAPMFLMYGRQTEPHGKSSGQPSGSRLAISWSGSPSRSSPHWCNWGFERSALLDFTMASTDNVLGGLVFVAAGLYQWTRLNDLCLAQCQRPFEFVMCHGGFRRDVPGCVVLGLRHGAYCVGCCWALMALLLVGGVMNVLWIALLALLAFLERVTSMGRVIARFAGIVLVVGGAWLFAMGMS